MIAGSGDFESLVPEVCDELEGAPKGGDVTVQDVPDLTVARQVLGGTSDEQIPALPGVLTGSAEHVAATLLRYREKYGLTTSACSKRA